METTSLAQEEAVMPSSSSKKEEEDLEERINESANASDEEEAQTPPVELNEPSVPHGQVTPTCDANAMNEEAKVIASLKEEGTVDSIKESKEDVKVSEPAKSSNKGEFSTQRRMEVSDSAVTTAAKVKAAPEANEDESGPQILSLPIDSLHYIASFLTPAEWAGFGQTGSAANRVCCEVVRRVRLHGFRCATEVITAWKLGQQADAKELAALYTQSGVPIYPQSLGHSYHTILWRMGVEVKQMQEANDNAESEAEAVNSDPLNTTTKVDPFYSERLDFRTREGYSPEITYLEEKCLYWTDQMASDSNDSGQTSNRRASRRVSSRAGAGGGTSRGNSFKRTDATSSKTSKIPVKIHQHLLDQHMLARLCVNDQDGAMVTAPVSLSVDFFHPSGRASSGYPIRSARSGTVTPENNEQVGSTLQLSSSLARSSAAANNENVGLAPLAQADAGARADEFAPAQLQDAANDVAEVVPDANRAEPPPPVSRTKLNSVLDRMDLEVFSSSLSASSESDDSSVSQELKRHLRSRFATYQRRLETFLSTSSTTGFEECILDFWDEFFPHSAGIHYHDRHTAVPRVSCLQKFLTKPCPKSIGVVQCEIERIKISTRGKGMKGRLFPTYEYRLFIRNRPHHANASATPESANTESDTFVRRDTVLMVAKNRGRKHVEASGVVATASSTKKGSNNYFLYMPQQTDVDAHFNKVNALEHPAKMNPNGACHDPVLMSDDAGSVLLGRLQSNFIGTEFQIFTPRLQKRPVRKPDSQSCQFGYSPSDDELDYDSVSSDNNSSRRSRFGRLSLRRNNPTTSDQVTSCGNSDTSSIRGRSRSVPRATSCPDFPQSRQARTNRRAIANTPDSRQQQSVMTEEEDGVITYTANLLGSRPRIMDVCVPKVSPDGVAGAEWRQYLDTSEDADDFRMLSCFKRLQQRLENDDQNNGGEDANQELNSDGGDDVTPDDFGLLALQNRPPWWNIELGSFVLNFGGRVSVASVKNFQLCDRHDQDRIMLQFGRIQGRHSFTMDFQHPLTAVQAFCIAISSLQSKISFG